MSKWGDRPHWEFCGHYLGSDAHGDWIGLPAGTRFSRPGAAFDAVNDQVTLVPAAVEDRRPGWVATFHGPGGSLPVGGHRVPIDLYVDMTTPPVWTGDVVRATDLDLDVVRGRTGRTWVDDEDEFAAHRTAYGYPADVVDLALTACATVSAAIHRGAAPFDGCHGDWLARVAGLSPC